MFLFPEVRKYESTKVRKYESTKVLHYYCMCMIVVYILFVGLS